MRLTTTITADESGIHQVIRGVGMFTLAIDGAVVFDDSVAPENADLSLIPDG